MTLSKRFQFWENKSLKKSTYTFLGNAIQPVTKEQFSIFFSNARKHSFSSTLDIRAINSILSQIINNTYANIYFKFYKSIFVLAMFS